MRQPRVDADDVVTSDAELIARVRAGTTSSYAELVVRHGAAAVRLAAQVAPESDPDVLVGEAFDRILQVLRAGGGPDIAFRAYLLSVVRRLPTADDPTPYEPAAAFAGSASGSAWASLPERWQLVLWHLDVEGQSVAELAPLLAMPAADIPALADQARDGLHQALLDLDQDPDPDLREVVGPVVLGGAATPYLGSRPAPVATTSHAASGVGVAARVRAAVPTRVIRPVGTAVGGCLAVATVVAVVVSGLGTGLGSGQPPHHGPADGVRTDRTSRSAPREIVADSVASTNGVPTASPTTAANLASGSPGTPDAAVSGSPGQSPASAATRTAAPGTAGPRPATADVSVAARSTTTLPRTYDVSNTLRGVPAGRTTSLVVQGSRGMVLTSGDMPCTGAGSSRLSCSVGGGTTQGSFSVVDLGTGVATATLRIAPVPGLTDPAQSNNATTLTFS